MAMRPEELKDGMQVRYYPSPSMWFVGTVDGQPWQLGSGHWVVRLKNMPADYATKTGKSASRNWVNAASLESLEPHDPGPTQTAEERLREIGHQIRTQDNRTTSEPIFIVQQRKRIFGLDPDYTEDTVWVNAAGACETADDDERRELDAKEAAGESTDGWVKTGFMDIWEFVTPCFTEKGCQEYIEANGHNLTEPRIYAATAYRNEEFIFLRNWLGSLTPPVGVDCEPVLTKEKEEA